MAAFFAADARVGMSHGNNRNGNGRGVTKHKLTNCRGARGRSTPSRLLLLLLRLSRWGSARGLDGLARAAQVTISPRTVSLGPPSTRVISYLVRKESVPHQPNVFSLAEYILVLRQDDGLPYSPHICVHQFANARSPNFTPPLIGRNLSWRFIFFSTAASLFSLLRSCPLRVRSRLPPRPPIQN